MESADAIRILDAAVAARGSASEFNPFAYLRDVFTRLPLMTNWQVKDLTPEAWAKTSQSVDLRAIA